METENRKRERQPEIMESIVAKKKCVFVPNWLIEVLEWIKRTELANSSLSTASSTFKQLCWPKLHMRMQERIVPQLEFVEQRDELFNLRPILKRCKDVDGEKWKEMTTIPIAKVQPPEYIRFTHLHLRFLDGQILEFVHNIFPRLKDVVIIYVPELYDIDDIRVGPLRYLLKMLASKISQIDLGLDYLTFFNDLYPGLVDGVQSIILSEEAMEKMDSIFQWLNAERADLKPKILGLYFNENLMRNLFIERVKEEFVRSTEPKTFIIIMHYHQLNLIPHFELENSSTEEMLAIYENSDNLISYQFGYPNPNILIQFLVRQPKRASEQFRGHLEKHFSLQNRTTFIYIRDGMHIGTFKTLPPIKE